MNTFRKNGCILLFVSAVLLQACAVARTPSPAALPEAQSSPFGESGAQTWKRFREHAEKAEAAGGPFRLTAGLRCTDAGGGTQRASALIWGNGKSGDPLRLDLRAGIGMTAAKIREDGRSILVYVPNENAARLYRGAQSPPFFFDAPLPLSPSGLALLLTGRWGTLFMPPGGGDAVPEHRPSAGGYRFTLRDVALPGLLQLSPDGSLVSWRGEDGWTVETVEADSAAPSRLKLLRIAHPRGYSVLIDIRETERVSPPYSDEQLALALPPGTMLLQSGDGRGRESS
jgi:hypothetical protein